VSAGASHPQRQALGVLAAALGLPTVKPFSGRAAPTVEHTTVAGQPATNIRPAGLPPWPALLVSNGATPDGRTHPLIFRLGLALARSGYAVCIPDLPGISAGELTPAAHGAALACTTELADDTRTRNGRVGLIGVSLGATLALLVGADRTLAPRISVVVCIAPFSDLEKVMLLATTGMYRSDGGLEPYPVPDELSLGLARSLAALVTPGSGLSRDAMQDLLQNSDPERFDALFAALPSSVRETIAALSPVHSVAGLLAPVEIATAPRDRYFPLAESLALAAINPNVTVTVTSALGHALPRLELGNLAGLRPLNRFFVRSIEAAAAA
jgi:pimeloyl-ACP methyl ester carboxylesterase